MNQEVKDFLSKAEIKLVEPYMVKCSDTYDILVIAEDITETVLCIDNECSPIWLHKKDLTIIQPKTRSIEDGLIEGDIITNFYGDRGILMANQYCVVLSTNNTLKVAAEILTYSGLIEWGYILKQ